MGERQIQTERDTESHTERKKENRVSEVNEQRVESEEMGARRGSDAANVFGNVVFRCV